MFDLLVIEGSFVDARVDVGNKISLQLSLAKIRSGRKHGGKLVSGGDRIGEAHRD
jgi:hypothetical protein